MQLFIVHVGCPLACEDVCSSCLYDLFQIKLLMFAATYVTGCVQRISWFAQAQLCDSQQENWAKSVKFWKSGFEDAAVQICVPMCF